MRLTFLYVSVIVIIDWNQYIFMSNQIIFLLNSKIKNR
jgi:hypothetical protein